MGGDRGDRSGSDRDRRADREEARYARRGYLRRGRGVGAAVLPWTGCAGKGGAMDVRGTLGSDPKSATVAAGHLPVTVGGSLRMTCMTIGDPRGAAGGRLTDAGSGTSGAM